MKKPRRFVESSQDVPLTPEEEDALFDDPEFWAGWREHVEKCREEERAKKLPITVVFPVND